MQLTSVHELNLIKQKNAQYPELMKGFEDCIRIFLAIPDIGICLKGSIANSKADQWSDIDFMIVVPDKDQYRFSQIKEAVIKEISDSNKLLTFFPATHLGMENLLIFFLNIMGQVVKIDVELIDQRSFKFHTPALKILHDPNNFLQKEGAFKSDELHSRYNPDFQDLLAKFIGWTWYTYTKVCRGEMLEAIDSIQVMRTKSFLPFLQKHHALPYEGYRYMESRLPDEWLKSVYETYPKGIERGAILTALVNLVNLFYKTLRNSADTDFVDSQKNNLEQMMALINKKEYLFSLDKT